MTGAAQGVGRAIAERLAQSGHVVVLDVAAQLDWQHADVGFVSGDAGDPAVARHATEVAEQAGPLAGWVNNAAVFRDTTLDRSTAGEVLELITAKLALAVTGCHTAVNHCTPAEARGDRECLIPSGAASCPRRAAIRHR